MRVKLQWGQMFLKLKKEKSQGSEKIYKRGGDLCVNNDVCVLWISYTFLIKMNQSEPWTPTEIPFLAETGENKCV